MNASEHYDTKARETSVGKRSDRSDLQKFHNRVKHELLSAYATNASRLLDLACGRGGDLHKWRASGIHNVLGVDVSGNSVREAQRRYESIGKPHSYTFMHHDLRRGFTHPDYVGACDVVTCMFALHYFFESEHAAHEIMRVVATHLRPGGHFIGVVPDASQVNELIRHGPYDDGCMRVRALWDGSPACFGSKYTCSIRGTVTEDSDAPEHLVYASVLQPLAEFYGLRAIPINSTPHLRPSTTCLHQLIPPYGPPYAACTSMYAAFVFQKTDSA